MEIVLIAILIAGILYIGSACIAFKGDLKEAEERLVSYRPGQMTLSYGNIEYLDEGTGGLLVWHGVFGGFGQGYESVKEFSDDYGIISPSRFGYLNGDILGRDTWRIM